MPLFQLVLVALIQGATEFLPVSSSGHLALLPFAMDLEDQGRLLDVAAHVGTLGAVIAYFFKDVLQACLGVIRLCTGRFRNPAAKTAIFLFVATVPVGAVGIAFEWSGLADAIRKSPEIIGWTTLLFGLLLLWSDKRGASVRSFKDWNLRDAMLMGIWQAAALIPGTSRSGAVITAARFLGYERSQAARLAMLMSVPAILGAGLLTGAGAVAGADLSSLADAAIVAAISFAAALAAITFMMKLLERTGYTPYVIYRIFLGVAIILVF
ncbi:MAG: undecaprenyl-diphosphate phosphatase [Albidovulum sp.]|nr:undecaprenyl-diphosphate phosphatase [Albidovulum sp.]MDE0531027.1 undecaprenyl-diphosphate phosphatase [Albidovulum sp.]